MTMKSHLQRTILVHHTPGNGAAWQSATGWFRSSQPSLHRWSDDIAASNFPPRACAWQCWNLFERMKISSKTFLITSQLWIWCSVMSGVSPCPLQWCFGGTGRRARWMLAWFKGFDLIVELLFLRVKYTGHSLLSPEYCVRWIWSKLPNKGTVVAPSSPHSYWSG